jgi:hypothetical protein
VVVVAGLVVVVVARVVSTGTVEEVEGSVVGVVVVVAGEPLHAVTIMSSTSASTEVRMCNSLSTSPVRFGDPGDASRSL